nr:NAD(P)-binding oxidoreductase [Frankia gtarii]
MELDQRRARGERPHEACTHLDAPVVRRLIAVSGYGVADSRHRNLHVAIARVAIRSLMRDKASTEELIRASATTWTIVRPALLTGGPRTGDYRTGTDLHLTITYADVADFMLAGLTRDDFACRAAAIAS